MQNESQGHSVKFEPGASVIYGLHGKCSVISIESKKMGNEQIQFYKLELVRNTPTRSKKKQSSIWVPVENAPRLGLRAPISKTDINTVMEIVNSKECYYDLDLPWATLHPQLERVVLTEGAAGLARVCSFLSVYERRLVVPPPEVHKFKEVIQKLFYRELSDVFQEPLKTIEEKITKAMRHKLTHDHH